MKLSKGQQFLYGKIKTSSFNYHIRSLSIWLPVSLSLWPLFSMSNFTQLYKYYINCLLGPRFVVNTGEVDSFGTVKVKLSADTQEIVYSVRAKRDAQVSYQFRENVEYFIEKKLI